MPDEELELRFHDRLTEAVRGVRQLARIGVSGIRKALWEVGGFCVAKDEHYYHASSYLAAAKRVGRMDLSVEAVMLEPEWAALFTPEEIESARSRLAAHGFSQVPRQRVTGAAELLPPPEQSFARIRIRGAHIREYGEVTCDLVGVIASQFREVKQPRVYAVLREHINQCRNCAESYPELVAGQEVRRGRATNVESAAGEFQSRDHVRPEREHGT